MNLMASNGAIVGVRPEDMALGGEGLQALVDGVEYLGADSLVAAKANEQALLVRVPGRASVRAGDAVRISWHKNNEHHFDRTTGERKP
jgi:sn-glycerol 3-phosphate transport system ATP-binding protein